jgi:hypothetical protein
MRSILQDLRNKVSGNPIYLVGGGYSLHNFNFDILKEKNVIAINSSFNFFDREDVIIFWADASWGQDNESNLLKNKSKYKFSSRINADNAIKNNNLGIGGCNWLKHTGNYGFDSDIDCVRGNNSGTQALNFAVNLGASDIYLLGFDMGYTGSKSHFHEFQKNTAVSNSVYDEFFIPSMNSMSDALNHNPVNIINCSINSKLECFSKIDFGDINE